MIKEGGGWLKIVPVEEAVPGVEYVGSLPPFHKRRDWMSMLFPMNHYDVDCPVCRIKFRVVVQ